MKNKDLINLKGFKPKMFHTDIRNYMSIETFNKIMDWLEKEVILDEVERKYLSDVCRPFECMSICKYFTETSEFLNIKVRNGNYINNITLPNFEPGTMYKGMELEKKYKPSELGITCKGNE